MGKGKVIAGFVLGIIGIVLGFLSGWFSLIALPVSIVGLVLAVIGGKQLKLNGTQSGLATAGLVLGIIAVVISAITFFTCGLCIICATSAAAGSTGFWGSFWAWKSMMKGYSEKRIAQYRFYEKYKDDNQTMSLLSSYIFPYIYLVLFLLSA